MEKKFDMFFWGSQCNPDRFRGHLNPLSVFTFAITSKLTILFYQFGRFGVLCPVGQKSIQNAQNLQKSITNHFFFCFRIGLEVKSNEILG